jgi:hypothetical protein
MTPVGFKPIASTSKRPQTHVLDSAATGIGIIDSYYEEMTKHNI